MTFIIFYHQYVFHTHSCNTLRIRRGHGLRELVTRRGLPNYFHSMAHPKKAKEAAAETKIGKEAVLGVFITTSLISRTLESW